MLFEISNVAVGTPSKMFAHFNRSMSNFLFYFILRNDREHLKTIPAPLGLPPCPRQAPGAAQHPGSSPPVQHAATTGRSHGVPGGCCSLSACSSRGAHGRAGVGLHNP